VRPPTQPLDEAYRLAEEGMAVFPVVVSPSIDRPGKMDKRPIGKWRDISTSDTTMLEHMNWKSATHVGIDCSKSGICVVDFDDMKQLLHVPLPITRIQETISGGQHWIFKAPSSFVQKNTTGIPRPGVDVRGDGGFIVWYGMGMMCQDDIAAWPFDRPLTEFSHPQPKLSPVKIGTIKPGARNHDLISTAGHFLHQLPHATFDQVLSLVTGHSHLYHEPALLPGEIRQVAESAMRWHKEAPQMATEEFMGKLRDMPKAEVPADHCGGWLRAGSYTLLYSRAGVGKTAVMAELVYCLKHNDKFFGQQCRDIGPILWVNGDMPGWQVNERIGWLGDQIDIWHLRFDNLMTRQEEFIRKCSNYKLVLLDNRSCLFELADANNAENWTGLNNMLRRIADSGCAVILATHEGKGESASSFGSTAQEWFTDTIIRASTRKLTKKEEDEKEEKIIQGLFHDKQLEWTKNRLCKQPETCHFHLEMQGDRLICAWKILGKEKT
jgi:hypothetical protein